MLPLFSTILETIRGWSVATPEKEALVFLSSNGQTQRLTYAGLFQKIQKLATTFRQLPLYSRIGLTARHGPKFLIESLAIMSAGHCLVPINGQLPSLQRDEMAERAGIHAFRHAGKNILTMCPGKAIDLASDEEFRAMGPAYLRFTSGSTGQRKGVLLSHRTIMERTAAANARLNITPADRVLCLLPMVDHFVVSVLLYLRYGATILLVENEADAPFVAKKENATVIYGAPNQYRRFTQPLPHIRLAVSSTQGLSISIANDFLTSTGKPLTQALGIIEAGLLTLNEIHATSDPLLAGVPMPDYVITINKQGGRDGEILVQGPGLLDAYVSPWRSRASLLTEHGFPTGDHGWIDTAGCLHVVGREKNRIQLDGITIFCEEIEAIINQHPDVQESLVFQDQTELVAQVVAPGSLQEPKALFQWISDKLTFIQSPIHVDLVEALPHTPTGKLARPRMVRSTDR